MSMYDPGHQTTKADKPQATENSGVEAPWVSFEGSQAREKGELWDWRERIFISLYLGLPESILLNLESNLGGGNLKTLIYNSIDDGKLQRDLPNPRICVYILGGEEFWVLESSLSCKIGDTGIIFSLGRFIYIPRGHMKAFSRRFS